MLVDVKLLNVVRSELDPGERLLWVSQPSPKRLMLASLIVFVFGVFWIAFTVIFNGMWHSPSSKNTASREAGDLFGIFGISDCLFFVLHMVIGVRMLLSPVWAAWNARHTVYGITNKRLLVIQTGKSRKVQSFDERELGNIARIERPDGSGELTFTLKTFKDSDSDMKDVIFIGIADVRSVERLVRETFIRPL